MRMLIPRFAFLRPVRVEIRAEPTRDHAFPSELDLAVRVYRANRSLAAQVPLNDQGRGAVRLRRGRYHFELELMSPYGDDESGQLVEVMEMIRGPKTVVLRY